VQRRQPIKLRISSPVPNDRSSSHFEELRSLTRLHLDEAFTQSSFNGIVASDRRTRVEELIISLSASSLMSLLSRSTYSTGKSHEIVAFEPDLMDVCEDKAGEGYPNRNACPRVQRYKEEAYPSRRSIPRTWFWPIRIHDDPGNGMVAVLIHKACKGWAECC
jgi:hypothetical protein